jgi:hypothetical protein
LFTFLCLAEIDKLEKRVASRPVEKHRKEIPRPDKITKLQHDMRLADNRKLYSHCRVLFYFFDCLPYIQFLYQATVRDVLARADLPLLDWRHQDLAAVAKVAEVVRSNFEFFVLIIFTQYCKGKIEK